MTRKYTSHSSSLFLMELILSILFFSIASAVCIQLFVKSHLLSEQAEVLAFAVSECSDAAEIIRSGDTYEDIEKRLRNAYPELLPEDGYLQIFYEESYQMQLLLQQTSDTVTASISFLEAGQSEPVYELEIYHVLSGGHS